MKSRSLFYYMLLIFTSLIHGRPFEEQTGQINVGALFNYARFNIQGLPRIDGYLSGIHFDIHRGYPSYWYTTLRFDGRWNAGAIRGNQNLRTTIKDYRPEFNLGYSVISFNKQYAVTPFVGFGFYYLSNALQPNVMTFRYFNMYVPFGINFLLLARQPFQLGFLLSYRLDAWTRLKLTTPALQTPIGKLKLKQTYGLHAELPFTWVDTCEKRVNKQVRVVPFFDWNHFGRSKQTTNQQVLFPLPELDRWFLGLRIDIGFNF